MCTRIWCVRPVLGRSSSSVNGAIGGFSSVWLSKLCLPRLRGLKSEATRGPRKFPDGAVNLLITLYSVTASLSLPLLPREADQRRKSVELLAIGASIFPV